MKLLELPRSTAAGDLIAYANEMVISQEGRKNRYTFSGGVYFQRMLEKGLYTLKDDEISERVKKLSLNDVFAQSLC